MLRAWTILVLALVPWEAGAAERPTTAVPTPAAFFIGRHTYFDFGPPFDFYQVYSVRAAEHATRIDRVTLTPAGDPCLQPASVETTTSSVDEPVEVLLAGRNPCAIPEKELKRERKRAKGELVFSGVNVVMEVLCESDSDWQWRRTEASPTFESRRVIPCSTAPS